MNFHVHTNKITHKKNDFNKLKEVRRRTEKSTLNIHSYMQAYGIRKVQTLVPNFKMQGSPSNLQVICNTKKKKNRRNYVNKFLNKKNCFYLVGAGYIYRSRRMEWSIEGYRV